MLCTIDAPANKDKYAMGNKETYLTTLTNLPDDMEKDTLWYVPCKPPVVLLLVTNETANAPSQSAKQQTCSW